MPDYRTFYDSDFLYAYHLAGKSVVVTIEKVVGGTMGHGAKKSKKPLVYFKGKAKPLGLNKTNGKTIATMYGNDTAAWVGERIEIYPTTTSFGNDTVDCIRVKPKQPGERKAAGDYDETAAPPNGETPMSPEEIEQALRQELQQ